MRMFASLQEDSQQGWVWLMDSSLPPRATVKITNRATGKSVVCEALQIDSNFLDRYCQPPRLRIEDPKEAIVASEWYRSNLGGIATNTDVDLEIVVASTPFGKFRACTHHPQIIVRVAAWLGLVSVVLGALGLVLGVVSLVPAS